jgi:hypothetical protein
LRAAGDCFSYFCSALYFQYFFIGWSCDWSIKLLHFGFTCILFLLVCMCLIDWLMIE